MSTREESERESYCDSEADMSAQPLNNGSGKRAVCAVLIAAAVIAAAISAVMNNNNKKENIETGTINSAAASASTETSSKTAKAQNAETQQEDMIAESDESAEYTQLFMVDDGAPVSSEDTDNGYADYYITGGLYTGKSENGETQIDILGGKAVVDPAYTLPVDSAKVLPFSTVSQFDGYGGESACGAAALAMLFGGDLTEIINYSDNNGYSDQGSLYSYDGGMTFESLQQLAADLFGADIVNAYTDEELPSLTVRKLIDAGYCVLATVNLLDDSVADYGASHFIVINGYMDYSQHMEFIYANSYSDAAGGIPLQHISSGDLDNSVLNVQGETVCIAYVG